MQKSDLENERKNERKKERRSSLQKRNEAGTTASILSKERGRNAFLKNEERLMPWTKQLFKTIKLDIFSKMKPLLNNNDASCCKIKT